MPIDKLEKTSDGYGTNLVSLLPVTSYKLTIVLEPACGYVFSFDHSKQQLTVFSWDTVGEKSTEPKTFFGSWGSLSPKPADN